MNSEIKFITAATGDKYGEIIPFWIEHVVEAGYEYQIYDLGDLGKGKKYKLDKEFSHNFTKSWPDCFWKPNVIKDALKGDKDKLIGWLDVDAIIQESVDELIEKDFDVCFTLRSQGELSSFEVSSNLKKGLINAGVAFYRFTNQTLDFLELCSKITHKRFPSDQHAINYLLKDKTMLPRELEMVFVPATKYNNSYFEEEPSMGKIIHWKGPEKHKKLLAKVS